MSFFDFKLLPLWGTIGLLATLVGRQSVNTGRTVFSQFMEFIPTYQFQLCVDRYQGNCYIEDSSCWDQFPSFGFLSPAGPTTGCRPPPSTASPCPAGSCPRRRPFLAGAKLQLRNDSHHFNCWRSFSSSRKARQIASQIPCPIPQPSPARGGRGKFLARVLATSPAAQNRQNPFQYPAVRSRRPTALLSRRSLGKQKA